jgi:hypothetical protein
VHAPTANEALTRPKSEYDWPVLRYRVMSGRRPVLSLLLLPMHLLLCRSCHTASVTFRRPGTDLE